MLIGGVNQNQPAAQGIAPQTAENSKTAVQQMVEQAENAVEDLVEISLASRQKTKDEQEGKLDMAQFMEQLENARAQGEAMGDMLDERIKCLQIAMRIMAGDKVPMEDMRFLAEKDPELFARSIMMKRQNDDPKKWKRLTEDEEDEGAENCDKGEGIGRSAGRMELPAQAEAAQPAGEAVPAATSEGKAAAE